MHFLHIIFTKEIPDCSVLLFRLFSGVISLEGAREQGIAGCPIDQEAPAQSAKN